MLRGGSSHRCPDSSVRGSICIPRLEGNRAERPPEYVCMYACMHVCVTGMEGNRAVRQSEYVCMCACMYV